MADRVLMDGDFLRPERPRRIASAGIDWSGPYPRPRDEDNPDLYPLQSRMIEYRRMRRDPVIREMLQAIRSTALSASWTVTARAGAPEGVAEQVRRQFGVDGRACDGGVPMDAVVGLCLEAVFDGVHVLERAPVIRWQDGGWRHYSHLYDVDSTSLDMWGRDPETGCVVSMWQRWVSGRALDARWEVPADRLVIATWEQRGDDPEGEGLARAIWWWHGAKRTIAKSMLIGVDRLSLPIPVVDVDDEGLTDRGYSKEEISQFVSSLYDQAQAIRAGESGALKTMKGLTLSTFGGIDTLKVGEFRSAIELCDEQIRGAGLVRFLGLGTSDAGARNVGEVHENVFRRGVSRVLDWVADVLTQQVILPNLRQTWGPAADAWCPTLRHEGLMPGRIEQALPSMGQIQALIGMDPAASGNPSGIRELQTLTLDAIRGEPERGV